MAWILHAPRAPAADCRMRGKRPPFLRVSPNEFSKPAGQPCCEVMLRRARSMGLTHALPSDELAAFLSASNEHISAGVIATMIDADDALLAECADDVARGRRRGAVLPAHRRRSHAARDRLAEHPSSATLDLGGWCPLPPPLGRRLRRRAGAASAANAHETGRGFRTPAADACTHAGAEPFAGLTPAQSEQRQPHRAEDRRGDDERVHLRL